VGHGLATRSVLREEVKLGIALIGFAGVADLGDVILTLGRHEEFTLYAAVALTNGMPDPETALWSLALHVEGWGRVQTVRRLAGTNNSQIKAWLIREGFRNQIMDEYLAYIAATTGHLLEALQAPHLDDHLWRGARDIIVALIAGGPAQDMGDYADGAEATELFLGHAGRRHLDVVDFNAITTIRVYLEGLDDGKDDRSAEIGWTRGRLAGLRATCEMLLDPPRWRDRVRSELNSSDDSQFWAANRAAHTLYIPTFSVHLQRLQADPTSPHKWFLMMGDCSPADIHDVITLAEHVLPLDDIATGPGRSLGLGPNFAWHQCLDAVLQGLRSFPHNGWPLIRVGLRSPVTRNRNMALKALESWDNPDWPPEAHHLLVAAAEIEPEPRTKELIETLLLRTLDIRP
jgi:hypothetical protein